MTMSTRGDMSGLLLLCQKPLLRRQDLKKKVEAKSDGLTTIFWLSTGTQKTCDSQNELYSLLCCSLCDYREGR